MTNRMDNVKEQISSQTYHIIQMANKGICRIYSRLCANDSKGSHVNKRTCRSLCTARLRLEDAEICLSISIGTAIGFIYFHLSKFNIMIFTKTDFINGIM